MLKEEQDRVLFFYIRDKKEPRRVMTIARYKQENCMTFAWSINKVTVDITDINKRAESFYQKHTIVHDTFNKKRGRQIAEARLVSSDKSITIELNDEERPLKAVLETLAGLSRNVEFIPKVVRSLAEQELANSALFL